MDENPHARSAWRSAPGRIIAGTGIAAALFASVLLPVPARAITTETAATLTETQQQVEETAAAYEKATENLDALQQHVDKNEAKIAELEAQLPDAQEKAGSAMRDLYKYNQGANSLMSFVLNTASLEDLITTVKYMGQIQSDNLDALEELNAMQAELEAQEAELAAAKAAAVKEQETASSALKQAQKLRERAQAKADAEAAAEQAALQKAAEEARAASEGSTGNAGAGSTLAQVNSDVDWDTDQAGFVAEWGPRIDAYLAGSPLAGMGDAFAAAAWKYGVDPRWSPAISNTESSKGRHCFKPHNAWGWGSSSWDSWEEAIDAHVAGLARGYGYTISVANAKKYCPPNWYNWYNDTLSEMGRI